MTVKEKFQRAFTGVLLGGLLKRLREEPEKNFVRLVNLVDRLSRKSFSEKNMNAIREGARDPENTWNQFAKGILRDVDPDVLKKTIKTIGLGVANGTRLVRKNREKFQCNIPFQILFDPTSACNLHCKGCWAGEYQKHENLTVTEMDSIISQGKKLGTRVFMLTGGEPLIRKNDIFPLFAKHKECMFLIYTNATLIDEAVCDTLKKLGNVTFAISLEGFSGENDARRGAGSFERSMKAIELLKQKKCLFGVSVCYTRENIPTVTSDEFVDMLIEKGAKFAFYFHYMPIGVHAAPELLPTAEQREKMVYWLRRDMRAAHGGKPIFIMDFQNDGAYVGGCIGGGRNYFHVNAAGDMEPCVFIHYSDSNIRENTLLEALRRPLFQAYFQNQPFNDNHFRPCPMLENPGELRKVIGRTAAASTDLEAPEPVEDLCAKCEHYAAAWRPVSEKLWEEMPKSSPKTQYHRDEPA